MKKQFFLFLAMLVFSFNYCNDNILIYKNDLKELKINTVIIQKRYNDKIYDLKVSVGEGFLGKVSSLSIEVLGNDNSLEKILLADKENIKDNIKNIISNYSNSARGGAVGAVGPVNTVGNCISKCTSTWHCSDKPTETGALLCSLDCALECSGA